MSHVASRLGRDAQIGDRRSSLFMIQHPTARHVQAKGTCKSEEENRESHH